MSLPEHHPRLKKRALTMAELLADGVVHAIAILVGLIGFSGLLNHVLWRGDYGQFAALTVYATGYFAMFGFSLAYNMVPASPLKWVLRRLDHSAIYVMIAGTYTAILAQFSPAAMPWALGALVWIGALLGALVKLFWPGRYDGLSVACYVALGFAGVLVIGPARQALDVMSLWLIALGGIIYVAGIGFYKWHRLPFHNAIWHFCVALAAVLHFVAIVRAVVG